jgi:hypothetical protein
MNTMLLGSYKTQRTVIGILGIVLGFACITLGLLQSPDLQHSISRYYYTNAQDLLVGTLVASAVFLLCYRGYDSIDSITSIIAGVTALGIACFPCMPGFTFIGTKVGLFQLPIEVSNVLHLLCAGVFFCTLIYVILFLFTKGVGIPTDNKVKRNFVYRMSGLIMIVGLLIVIASNIFNWPAVLIGEVIMLTFYGIAWLTKGEVILPD